DPGWPRGPDPHAQPVLRALTAEPLGDQPSRRAARDHLLPDRRRRRADRRPPGAGARGMSDPVVSLSNVRKEFGTGGVVALEGINLEIGEREFISLIGPSGCGKSTLLRIIGDPIQPTAGHLV